MENNYIHKENLKMGNHKMIIYEPKGIFKTALKVGIGIKLGLELGDFIYYIALKTISNSADIYFIKQAKKGLKGAKECCKKYGLDYEDDNSEDS